MLIEPLDTLLAYKALSLSPGLSSAERRVAAAIIDHFNRETGRCDPSVDRLARLLCLDRGTVIRAVEHLDELGLIPRQRHGGRRNTNGYAPDWVRFREIDAVWQARFNADSTRSMAARSPARRLQSGRGNGGRSATQTLPKNPSKEPFGLGETEKEALAANVEKIKAGPTSISSSREPPRHIYTPSSREVAEYAAQRRWASVISDELIDRPKTHAQLIEAIDDKLSAEATQAELRCPGGGVRLIFERLRHRVVGLPVAWGAS